MGLSKKYNRNGLKYEIALFDITTGHNIPQPIKGTHTWFNVSKHILSSEHDRSQNTNTIKNVNGDTYIDGVTKSDQTLNMSVTSEGKGILDAVANIAGVADMFSMTKASTYKIAIQLTLPMGTASRRILYYGLTLKNDPEKWVQGGDVGTLDLQFSVEEIIPNWSGDWILKHKFYAPFTEELTNNGTESTLI